MSITLRNIHLSYILSSSFIIILLYSWIGACNWQCLGIHNNYAPIANYFQAYNISQLSLHLSWSMQAFCRTIPYPQVRAACWAVQFASIPACSGFCYWYCDRWKGTAWRIKLLTHAGLAAVWLTFITAVGIQSYCIDRWCALTRINYYKQFARLGFRSCCIWIGYLSRHG